MHSLVNRKAQVIGLYPMNLTHQECIKLLEEIRWKNQPCCPYCGSKRASAIEKGRRHHCNDCFTSYSVTVGTIFHKTHVDLQKWFHAIYLVCHKSPKISSRKLAQEVNVNKTTAAIMIKRIRQTQIDSEKDLIEAILKKVLNIL